MLDMFYDAHSSPKYITVRPKKRLPVLEKKSGVKVTCRVYQQRRLTWPKVDISERPAVVESRIGDWEAGTIISHGSKTPLLIVVDRKLAKMGKMSDKTSASIALVKVLKTMENQVHTITFDNGGEFAKHEKVTLGAKIFFARPYHSCERGLAHERPNLPVSAEDFKDVSDKKIKENRR
jgi:IS30 family transposase